jgi:hypothetical protein
MPTLNETALIRYYNNLENNNDIGSVEILEIDSADGDALIRLYCSRGNPFTRWVGTERFMMSDKAARAQQELEQWLERLEDCYGELEAMREAEAMDEREYDDQDREEIYSNIEYINDELARCRSEISMVQTM